MRTISVFCCSMCIVRVMCLCLSAYVCTRVSVRAMYALSCNMVLISAYVDVFFLCGVFVRV